LETLDRRFVIGRANQTEYSNLVTGALDIISGFSLVSTDTHN